VRPDECVATPGGTVRRADRIGWRAGMKGRLMDRSEILEKMRETISDQLNIDASKIVEGASLTKDLGADSLDLLQLVTELEDQYGIEIPDEDLEKMQTVGDVLDELEKLV
jgi:acyl carrier protein